MDVTEKLYLIVLSILCTMMIDDMMMIALKSLVKHIII